VSRPSSDPVVARDKQGVMVGFMRLAGGERQVSSKWVDDPDKTSAAISRWSARPRGQFNRYPLRHSSVTLTACVRLQRGRARYVDLRAAAATLSKFERARAAELSATLHGILNSKGGDEGIALSIDVKH